MTCAYLTLVMKVDEYDVSWALVLARSPRLNGTQHVIACMTTDDVSLTAQADLRCIHSKFMALHRELNAVHVVESTTERKWSH
jgi:hypothetical protein